MQPKPITIEQAHEIINATEVLLLEVHAECRQMHREGASRLISEELQSRIAAHLMAASPNEAETTPAMKTK